MSIEDYHQVFPEIILEEEGSSNGEGKFWVRWDQAWLKTTFPEAFSNAATISKTDVPLPVPRL
jgi:hypothetical protein